MRTTITLDDDLVRTAQEYTGVTEKTTLIRVASQISGSEGGRAQAGGFGGHNAGV